MTSSRVAQVGCTRSYPAMIYSNLSEVAVVRVVVYPTDRVEFWFSAKALQVPAARPADL
jgi:hypothetical protein